ncbi:hypothetical protein PRVXT_002292 [Proteinivorax tanatarense]|uniref:DUF5673 domain-containing protein n=1 Tax=Proteinivorax tanatarense TaxID=1260629 RepID=A0AAU7VK97_9FIRM
MFFVYFVLALIICGWGSLIYIMLRNKVISINYDLVAEEFIPSNKILPRYRLILWVIGLGAYAFIFIYPNFDNLKSIYPLIESGQIDSLFRLMDVDYLTELKAELYHKGEIDKYRILTKYIHSFSNVLSGLVSLTGLALIGTRFLFKIKVTELGVIGAEYIKFDKIDWYEFIEKGEDYGQLNLYKKPFIMSRMSKRPALSFAVTFHDYEKIQNTFEENQVMTWYLRQKQ